jgi:hypothetical protein
MLTSQLLKIRAAAVKILLYGQLSTTELAYDAFLVEFREIVLLAKEFFRNPEVTKTAPEGGFTANSGVLYDLRLVVEKCRDKRTRGDAISLMKSTAWREGPWWSSSVAQIGERLMSVEEEDLGYGTERMLFWSLNGPGRDLSVLMSGRIRVPGWQIIFVSGDPGRILESGMPNSWYSLDELSRMSSQSPKGSASNILKGQFVKESDRGRFRICQHFW